LGGSYTIYYYSGGGIRFLKAYFFLRKGVGGRRVIALVREKRGGKVKCPPRCLSARGSSEGEFTVGGNNIRKKRIVNCFLPPFSLLIREG